MKKLILSIAATSVVALSGHAQQLLFADNGTDNTDTTINGVANNSDLNLELLVGSTSTTVTTDVVTLLLNGAVLNPTSTLGSVQPAIGDITASGGDIYDPTGSAYTVPAGTSFAEVLAWTGNFSSYTAAQAGGAAVGSSGVFALVPAPAAGSPASDISNIESIPGGSIALTSATVIPEPSTLAMAGVGVASMLMFRRKNK